MYFDKAIYKRLQWAWDEGCTSIKRQISRRSREGPPQLFLDQIEALRAEKN